MYGAEVQQCHCCTPDYIALPQGAIAADRWFIAFFASRRRFPAISGADQRACGEHTVTHAPDMPSDLVLEVLRIDEAE